MSEFLIHLWKKCQTKVNQLLHGGYVGEFAEFEVLGQVFDEELETVGEIENYEKIKSCCIMPIF